MNWYNLYKQSLQLIAKTYFKKLAMSGGEFWIMGGQAMGADGDIGDYNHEGYAIETAQRQIMDGEENWEHWKWEAASEIFDRQMEQTVDPVKKQELQKKWDYNQEDFFIEALREKGINSELYQMAEGSGDIRNLAMELWGWKIVRGTDVQTWNLNSDDLEEIIDGLWDAYQDDIENQEITIEVMSNNQIFDSVPFDVLKERGLNGLAMYMRR